FTRIASKLHYPHEFAALEVAKGAAALPLTQRATFVRGLTVWIEKQQRISMLGDEAATIAAGLLRHETLSTALELGDALFALAEERASSDPDDQDEYRSRTPRARMNDYDFEHALERFSGPFIAKDPARAFAWAHTQLDLAMSLSESRWRIARGSDSSLTWRPSIAHGGAHYGHAYANALV